MPNSNLNNQDNFESISKWLKENLNKNNSLIPHSDKIPETLTSKGIYFWFMHTDGYKKLSDFVDINPIDPKYSLTINGKDYDLVYLGTAGTGKKGNSDLKERLEWHIKQHHTENNICHGTLSTLRAGLGALLAEDLINTLTEELVNNFMKKYMKVYWIPYEYNKELINNDEKILIKTIKPLLNIKNNPNAKANEINNPTKQYKDRRIIVYQATRERLGCANNIEIKFKNNLPTNNTPLYEFQVLEDDAGCIEFVVKQNQSIHAVVNGIPNLPKGKCEISISCIHTKDVLIYINRVLPRKTGSKEQNIYGFFSATDKKIPKWKIIQNEMNQNNIEEITVKVCSK